VAKTPAQKTLDDVIARALVPALKPRGYRKAGRTFRRTAERCVQVVNVQSSVGSTAEIVRFTLNLGVYFPEVNTVGASLYRTSPGPAGPDESECHLRTRIGALLPGNGDHWWEVAANANVDAVVATIDLAIRDHGLPWLDEMADFDTARREAACQRGPDGIMFALVAGARDDARALVAALLADRPHATGLASWARTQGLLD
jgi:hypothetical protein